MHEPIDGPGCFKVIAAWFGFFGVVFIGVKIWDVIPEDTHMIILIIAIILMFSLLVFQIASTMKKSNSKIQKLGNGISTMIKMQKLKNNNIFYNNAMQEFNKIKNEKHNSRSMFLIERNLNEIIKSKPEEIFNENNLAKINNNPKEWVYNYIVNITHNMIISGQYHVYRGVLDFTGMELLKIFDEAIEKLYQINPNNMNKKNSKLYKNSIRKEIESVG